MTSLVLIFFGLAIGVAAGGAAGAAAGLLVALLAISQNELRRTLREEESKRKALEMRLANLERRVAAGEIAPVAETAQRGIAPESSIVSAPVPATSDSAPASDAHAREVSAGATSGIAPSAPAPSTAPELERISRPGTAAREPEFVEAAREPSRVVRWLLGGNFVARLGVVILFFGVAFFLKFAAEHGLLPPWLRVSGVACAGLAMVVGGAKLRTARPMFALILQGGGVGLLYLAVFAMLRLYGMINEGPAFLLFAAIGLATVLLAVRQNAQPLAVLGLIGAFIAPVLASTGSGSHVVLFGYYLLLDLVVLAIAWFRPWRSPVVTGFLFTFVIGLVWGYRYYRENYFSTTAPFLLAFFALYATLPMVLARRDKAVAMEPLHAGLLFGTPIISFLLQHELVQHLDHGVAWSAAGFGLFYFACWAIARRVTESVLLPVAYRALGFIFLTLAIPYAFSAEVTVGLWALEGAGLVWLGARQQSQLARAGGLILQVFAAVAYLSASGRFAPTPVILNEVFLSGTLLAGAGLASAFMLHAARDDVAEARRPLLAAVLAWGLMWWYATGLGEIQRHAPSAVVPGAWLAFVALSAAAGESLGRRAGWDLPRYQSLLLLLAMAVLGFDMVRHFGHPLAHAGFVAWPLAFSVYYWSLQQQEEDGLLRWLDARHAVAAWLALAFASAELAWLAEKLVAGGSAWGLAGWVILPTAAIAFLARRSDTIGWPIGPHATRYLTVHALPVAIYLAVWSVYVNVRSTGDPSPLPYLPLLNPLDLAQALTLHALVAWQRRAAQCAPGIVSHGTAWSWTFGFLGLLWTSGIVARTVHHYAGVRFAVPDLFASTLLQASLSLLWTTLALALMVYANRTAQRIVWIAGAGLLALVTAKLFLVDLANSGTVARIVTFIGVGLLFLAVGYISPVPPAASTRAAEPPAP